MSYGVEATDGSGYARNCLRFETKLEATAYRHDLLRRWLGCQGARVVEYPHDIATHRFSRWSGQSVPLRWALERSNHPMRSTGPIGARAAARLLRAELRGVTRAPTVLRRLSFRAWRIQHPNGDLETLRLGRVNR